MSLKKGITHNLSIVVIGNFNPVIISPSWLANKELIRNSEAEIAEIKVIHPELSSFSLYFAEIQVAKDKFILNCNNEADFELCLDLVTSIFSILGETPASAIGLNHVLHFRVESQKEYDRFGCWLADINIWKDSLNDPKILELKMAEPLNTETQVKNLVTIMPSDKVSPFGVRLQLNYHIEYIKLKRTISISEAISNHWKPSMDKAKFVLSNTLEKFKK